MKTEGTKFSNQILKEQDRQARSCHGHAKIWNIFGGVPGLTEFKLHPTNPKIASLL